MTLPGFDEVEPADGEGWMRGVESGTHVRIRVRLVDAGTPQGALDVHRARRAQEIGTTLPASTPLIRVRRVEARGSDVLLVTDDPGGAFLDSALPTELPKRLRLVAKAARALDALHRGGVVHRDVKPKSFIVDDDGAVWLGNLGLAARLPKGGGRIASGSRVEGTLAYMAPEQTGRVGRDVDHRADLYGFGALLYELASGVLPFRQEDPLELIHAHLALQPPPLPLDAHVRELLEGVLAKLLAKAPEERYRSALGLAADLDAAADALESGARGPLPLGRHDVAPRLALSQRLFGRDAEIGRVVDTFARTSEGASEVLFVRGYSGIGKSALIGEAQRAIAERRGRFAVGKFDEFHRDVPGSAFLQAIRACVEQVFAGSEASLDEHRAALDATLGANAALLFPHVPELEALLGPRTVPANVGAKEAQNRFVVTLGRLVAALATGTHPLVIFLDDLQWADAASVELLSHLATGGAKHLLLLGAYRDNEVSASHPLRIALDALERGGVHVEEMGLGPLAIADVTALLADSLQLPMAEAAPLAEVLGQKTGNNPFFLNQFLETLVERELIVYDAAALRWRWDLDAVRLVDMTDNVVDLLSARIRTLPEAAQRVLAVASCLGDAPNLRALAAVVDVALDLLGPAVWSCIDAGMLTTDADAAAELAAGRAVDDERAVVLRFRHDRVHQAAYQLGDDQARAKLHARIGLALLDAKSDDLFAIVNHLNAGRGEVTGEDRRRELARLNLEAAERAASLTANDAAQRYLEAGIALLAPDAWETSPEVTRELLSKRAAGLVLSGKIDEGEALFATVVSKLSDARSRAEEARRRSEALQYIGHPARAYDVAREGLALLGIELPNDPDEIAKEAARASARVLTPEGTAALRSPRRAPDDELLVTRLYDRLIISAYFSCPQNLGLIIARNLERAIEHGITAQSAEGTAWFATLRAMGGDHEGAIVFAEIALELSLHFADAYYGGRAAMLGHCMALCWKQPFETTRKALSEAFPVNHGCGDFQYASYTLISIYIAVEVQGQSLPDILAQCIVWRDYCERYVPLELGQATIRVACLRRVMGERDDTDCDAIVAAYEAEKNLTDVCESLLSMAHAALLLGQVDQALAYAGRAEPLFRAGAAGALLMNMTFAHVRGLALVEVAARERSADRKASLLAQADEEIARLDRWAAFAPDNFASYAGITRAARARAAGDFETALAIAIVAMEHARLHGYLLVEAGAARIAGAAVRTTRPRLAESYAEEARSLFLRAGAHGVLAAMAPRETASVPVPSSLTSGVVNDTAVFEVRDVDLLAVLRASQTISQEIQLARLAPQLLHICVQNAGAQRGTLLLNRNGKLVVASEQVADETDLRASSAPASVVLLAQRTARSVVVEDASESAAHADDPVVRERGIRSVLAVPVLSQGRVLGVVCLENNLHRGAFTRDRRAVTELLAAQAAISLDNAELYETLEQRVRDRTQELAETLRLVTEGSERLRSELAEAADFVRGLLPAPITAPLRIDWRFDPSTHLGGDGLGYETLPDGRVLVYLIDVCGHGMAPALLSIAVLTAIHARRIPDVDFSDPASLLTGLNRLFRAPEHNGLFFTAWFGIIDPRARTIHFSNAGHPPATLLTRPANGPRRTVELDAIGPMVGIDDHAEYHSTVVHFDEHARLFIFSDGVYELFRTDGSLVDYAEFLAELERPGADLDGDLDRMRAFAAAARGGQPLEDDYTMIGIEIGGAS